MLDKYFKITERGSTLGREIRGGVVTFFTMAYIVALNPLIIGLSKDADGKYLGGGDAPNLALVAAATALIAGVLTILMGVVGNYPLALATGLGLNTFVAVGIASKMSWADAMGLVVLEGIIITVLVLTGFRTAVFRAVPAQLKIAISVGIGLFIALIGLVDAGFVRRTGSGPVPVTLGDNGTLVGWPVIIFALGLFLMIALLVKKVKGALLIGIAVATVAAIAVESAFKIGPNFIAPDKVNPKGWGLNVPSVPSDVIAKPDFGLLGQFSLFGSFERISVVAAILIVFTLLLSDFFDTVGTVTAIGHESGLIDSKGNIPNNDRILLVDSLAAVAGGAGSISSNTSYIESASGVGEGARTGFASVVTGILFLLTTFLAPLVAVIPYEAATPALVIVGFLMMTQIKGIDWADYGIAIPAFLTIILMPFTYNISVGIGAGFVSHVVIRLVQGRRKEVHPLLILVSILFMVYFLASPINTWLG
ncbi:MAG: NCS2 family permease [Actinobacteria bacterium]|jgi:AGZA family xanthine/uracil permease-like MFS transporter|nr:NCS2 family permease [Actinomycetota bacterium]NDA95975.1 NCS2 family permease [Actinomycetota bacterium]NDH80973.1 NCS2 family permease [Actinomycetota bacterium]NDH98828.1 NCS2 family permease [Actinomycetota bacterium]NDI07805.1 NCS2 family permease [Actinomycetota bacterium]